MIYVDCTLLALVPFQLIYFIVSCVRVDEGDAWGRGHLEKKSENTFLSSRPKLGVPLTPKKNCLCIFASFRRYTKKGV